MAGNDVTLRMGSRYDDAGGQAARQDMNAVKSSASELGISFSGVATIAAGMFAGFTMQAVIGEIRATVTDLIELDSTMNAVRDSSGMTADEINRLKDRFQETGPELQLTTAEMLNVAAAASQLADMPDESIASFTEEMGRAAMAMPEVSGGATALVDIMGNLRGSFDITNDETQSFLATVNSLANQTHGGAAAILEFMTSAQGLGRAFGVTATDAAAMASAFANVGISGSRAEKALEMAFTNMEKNSDKAAESLGLLPDEIDRLRTEGASATFKELVLRLGEVETAADRNRIIGEIFGESAIKIISPLVDALGGSGGLADAFDTAGDSAGSMAGYMGDVEAAGDTLDGKVTELSLTWGTFKEKALTPLIPVLGATLEIMTGVASIAVDVADGWRLWGEAITEGLDYLAEHIDLVAEMKAAWIDFLGILATTGDYSKTAIDPLTESVRKLNAEMKKQEDQANATGQAMVDAFNASLNPALDFEAVMFGVGESFGMTADAMDLWKDDLDKLWKNLEGGVSTLDEFMALLNTWGTRLGTTFEETMTLLNGIPARAKDAGLSIAEYIASMEAAWQDGSFAIEDFGGRHNATMDSMATKTAATATAMEQTWESYFGEQEPSWESYWDYLLNLVEAGSMSMLDASIAYMNAMNEEYAYGFDSIATDAGEWAYEMVDAADYAMGGMQDEFDAGFDDMEEGFRDAGGRMADAFNEEFGNRFGWGREEEWSSNQWYSWSGSRYGQNFDPTGGNSLPNTPGNYRQSDNAPPPPGDRQQTQGGQRPINVFIQGLPTGRTFEEATRRGLEQMAAFGRG